MAKTRVKRTVITGVTSEQVEAALSEFSQADSRIQKITAEMELKITAIRDKHAEELAELQKKKDDSMEILQVFATENKESLFSKTKELQECSWNFRIPHRNSQDQATERFYKGIRACFGKSHSPGLHPHGGRSCKGSPAC